MPILTDIKELKGILEIDPLDTSEDKKLMFLIEMASQWIEEWLDRPGLFLKARTEYYNGTNTQKLLLRSRPVFTTPTIQVFLDESGYFGSVSGSFDSSLTALTYGEDFALKVDQEDGSSRSGILIRINNLWPRPSVRQAGLLAPFIGEGFGSIKVTYTAGYYVDNLPPVFRLACNILVAQLRYMFPLGFLLASESFEERSISIHIPQKLYFLSMITPMLLPYKNWFW